jgi:hypothetical protein
MRGCRKRYEYWYEGQKFGSLMFDDGDTADWYDACYTGGKMVSNTCGMTNVWGEQGFCEECESLMRGENIRFLKHSASDTYHGGDVSHNHTWVAKLPKGTTDSEAWNMFSARLDTRGCNHEYDCCGCSTGGVFSIEHTKRREWRVKASYGYNY